MGQAPAGGALLIRVSSCRREAAAVAFAYNDHLPSDEAARDEGRLHHARHAGQGETAHRTTATSMSLDR